MKNRPYIKLFVMLFLFMALCLVSTSLYAQESNNQDSKKEETAADEGRKMTREAQEALLEAQRRYQTAPDDLASARQPLIDYLATPQAQEETPPQMLYEMLGQFWYNDDKADKHMEEARKIYKAGYEAYPEDDNLLLDYAVTSFASDKPAEAAPLFEKYYEQNQAHDIKYLEYAGGAYYSANNFKEAKRVYVKMIGLATKDQLKPAWFDSLIYICEAMEDSAESEKYIKLALDHYPMEKKYWKLWANARYQKEDLKAATACYEIGARVEKPTDKTEWRTLIDLYNYLGLPLRSAKSIQMGMDLLAKEKDSSVEKQELAVADAYARALRVDKAVAYLDSVIAKTPTYDLKLKKATILYNARRNKEAMAALDDCIAMDKKAYSAYFMKGMVAWDMKEWKIAEDAFDNASSAKDDTIRLNSKDALDMLADLDKAKNE